MSTSTPKKDSGLPFKSLVRLGGLAAIISVFLPFWNGGKIVGSGFELVRGLVEYIQLNGMTGLSGEISLVPDSTMGLIMGAFQFLVPVVFALTGLYMLVMGKYEGGPFTLLILIVLSGWLGFQFGMAETFEQSFWSLAHMGFWIGVGALGIPFFGMFFLDKSV